jgi:hypothetical protein
VGAEDAPGFAPDELEGVGVFFCGMSELPLVTESSRAIRPNSAVQ